MKFFSVWLQNDAISGRLFRVILSAAKNLLIRRLQNDAISGVLFRVILNAVKDLLRLDYSETW